MITFAWLRGGVFKIFKDGEGIGTFTPSTKEKTKISFNSDFSGDREEEENKIIKVFFEEIATA